MAVSLPIFNSYRVSGICTVNRMLSPLSFNLHWHHFWDLGAIDFADGFCGSNADWPDRDRSRGVIFEAAWCVGRGTGPAALGD